MTKEELIRLAQEAGWDGHHCQFDTRIERFAALVAAAERERAIEISKGMQEELQAKFEQTYMEGVIAGATAEREACAKVCDEHAKRNYNWASENADIYHAQAHWAGRIAAAIRARGQE